MSLQQYIDRKFTPDSLELIETMNEIVQEYVDQGFRLTVRQLYYQLVARAIIENTERSYKRTTSIVNDAKLAGLMDWEAIEDRTREFSRLTRWKSGAHIVRAAADSYHMDMWVNQKHRVFVIVEKEALAGVLQGVCNELDIPLLAARGYPSGTVLREFAISDLRPCFLNDEGEALKKRQAPILLHLGDHDPSGIDMSRDLDERLYLFASGGEGSWGPMFRRIALNMSQIIKLKPPENPAKATDARFASYRAIHGDKSWELDALQPSYLAKLVRDETAKFTNKAQWKERSEEVESIRAKLTDVADEFEARV